MRHTLLGLFFTFASAVACIPPPARVIGGTIVGLAGSVTIANNGNDTLSLSANSNFVFAVRATDYNVTVLLQPPGEVCTVANGTGTAGYHPITDVAITCASDPNGVQNGNGDTTTDGNLYAVSGTIAGLTGTITLKMGSDFVTVSAPQTSFAFPADLLDGATYMVEVSQQPFNQSCTVTNGSGSIDGANVSNVSYTCAAGLRTISYNLLGSSGPVTVLNNGSDASTSTVDGTYTFATPLTDGAKINVTVFNEPNGQACVIPNGYGILQGTNIGNINVNCQSPTGNYSIGGVAAGMTGAVVLNNAGIENITVNQAGAFTFPTPLTPTSVYKVTIASQPAGQACAMTTISGSTITSGAQGQAYSNVNNLHLNCATAYTVGGTVSGLASGGKLRLINNGNSNDVLTLTANGAYTFTKGLNSQATYNVQVMTEPANQNCVVTAAASGSIASANVTGVNVACTTTTVPQYTVGGYVSGLNGNVILSNAGVESITVSGNGNATFTFPSAMVSGSPYRMAVTAASGTQFCSTTANVGTIASRNVTSIAVSCVAGGPVTVPVSGLNGTMTIENTQGATAVVTANGSITMPGVFDRNAYIQLTVASAPAHQQCVMLNGSGTIASGFAPSVRCGPFYAFVDGQNANVVLGQPNFLTNTCNLTNNVAAQTLCNPYGDALLSTAGELFVADSTNNRVMGFAGIPQTNNSAASLVLGQSSFTSYNAAVSATGLSQPSAVAGNSNHIVLADTNNNRVLIYVPQPTGNHAAAAVVIGQASMTTSTAACSATGLNQPQGVFVVGQKLFIADSDNNRVLVYNTIPTANNQQPDFVIGQPNLTTCATNTGTAVSAATLTNPSDVWSDGTVVLIADSYSNRVLAYATTPTANGASASLALGQSSLTASTAAVGNTGLTTPTAVTSNGMEVFVADSGNNRVVVWGALPSIINNNYSGPSIDHVLGQPYNDQSYCNGAGSIVAPATLCIPNGVSISGNSLIVTDTSNSRYVVYEGF